MNNMENKVVIITGASSGIGEETARVLAKNGAKVVLSARREDRLKKLADEIGENAVYLKSDVSSLEDMKALVALGKNKFGKIDVLINNAGISQTKLFTDLTDEDWNNMIQTNLTSAFYCTQEAIKSMISKKNGLVINISSIWGVTGASCEVHYSVAKAGIDGMTKSLAKELGPSNIRVNSIAPGMINTDMNKIYTDEEIKDIIEDIPLNKVGKTIDIARCVEWLIEDEYTTGQVISINGGWLI